MEARGVMGEKPINKWGAPHLVEFNKAEDCAMVHHMMHEHSMKFAEAIDYLELRQDYHFTVRAEAPDDKAKF